jgi:hypothetical protein
VHEKQALEDKETSIRIKAEIIKSCHLNKYNKIKDFFSAKRKNISEYEAFTVDLVFYKIRT